MSNKEEITFDEFLEIEKKLDICIGVVLTAERIPKSKKLLNLSVSFGAETLSVVTNLGDKFEPEAFINIALPFIMNLTTSVIMGVESQAMIMVGETTEGVIELNNYSLGSKLM